MRNIFLFSLLALLNNIFNKSSIPSCDNNAVGSSKNSTPKSPLLFCIKDINPNVVANLNLCPNPPPQHSNGTGLSFKGEVINILNLLLIVPDLVSLNVFNVTLQSFIPKLFKELLI